MQRHWPHVDMDQTYLSNPIEICGKCEYNHIMIDLKRLKDDRRAQKAGYSERVKAIRNVQSYVDLACQTQAAAIQEEIPDLESQKYESSLGDSIMQLKDTIGMLNGDLYSTVHGVDVERDGCMLDMWHPVLQRGERDCALIAIDMRRAKNIIIDKRKPLVDKRLWQGQ